MTTTVNDVIERLAALELSNTKFSDVSDSELGQQNRVLYLNAIQKALVHLYSEFDLREGWFELVPVVGRAHYSLNEKASMSLYPNTGYINDLDKAVTFTDSEVMTIYACTTSKGEPVGINDSNDPYSVFIDKYNRILIPAPIKGERYLFTYRAYHPRITGVDNVVDIADADVAELGNTLLSVWESKYPNTNNHYDTVPAFTDPTLEEFGVAEAENITWDTSTYVG